MQVEYMSSERQGQLEVGTSSPTQAALPTEDEAWASFWAGIAAIWVTLPPSVQQEYAARYPKGQEKAAG
jgi:hypothetical protein